MKKVRLKKEYDNAILFLKKEMGYSFEDFMRAKSTGDWMNTKDAFPLNELKTETLAHALLEGYEVEQEPEEVLYDYFTYHKSMNQDEYHLGIVEGIYKTLDYLDIDIKGINIT